MLLSRDAAGFTIIGPCHLHKDFGEVPFMPPEHAVALERKSLQSRSNGMLPFCEPLTDWPVPKHTLRKEMVPLHIVVMGVNIVHPVVTHALCDIRDIQVPVGFDHNTFARVWEVGTLARKPPTHLVLPYSFPPTSPEYVT